MKETKIPHLPRYNLHTEMRSCMHGNAMLMRRIKEGSAWLQDQGPKGRVLTWKAYIYIYIYTSTFIIYLSELPSSSYLPA